MNNKPTKEVMKTNTKPTHIKAEISVPIENIKELLADAAFDNQGIALWAWGWERYDSVPGEESKALGTKNDLCAAIDDPNYELHIWDQEMNQIDDSENEFNPDGTVKELCNPYVVNLEKIVKALQVMATKPNLQKYFTCILANQYGEYGEMTSNLNCSSILIETAIFGEPYFT